MQLAEYLLSAVRGVTAMQDEAQPGVWVFGDRYRILHLAEQYAFIEVDRLAQRSGPLTAAEVHCSSTWVAPLSCQTIEVS